MLIDTHCHIDCAAFDHDRLNVIERSYHLGVTKMMMIGVRASDWPFKLSLAEKYPNQLYPVLGCHPLFLDDHQLSDIELLADTISRNKVTAIGENGLDYYHKKPNIVPPDKALQQVYFERQLEIAQNYKLPVILHVRKAHDEVIKTLKKYHIVSGIAHAFNGSIQHAYQYADLGFKVGVGGMITHPHSNKLHKLFKDLPLDNIVLETDAPDLTVFSHKGERNSPEFLPDVCQFLSELKDESYQVIAKKTTDNAMRSLGL